MSSILMHTNPDWDAITAAWLLERFYPPLKAAALCFIGAADIQNPLLQTAEAVVDVGLKLDRAHLRFDHHQAELGRTTCAALLVYDFLLECNNKNQLGSDLLYLKPLIMLVHQADNGQRCPEVEFSYKFGMHALLSAEKYRQNMKGKSHDWDMTIAHWGFRILDSLEMSLRKSQESRKRLDECTAYISADKKIRAIRGPCIDAAFEQGAHVIVFEGEPREAQGTLTYPVMISRASHLETPHLGELVDEILTLSDTELGSELRSELRRWWKHPVGFYAGRGSTKAPLGIPLKVTLEEIAELIDKQWKR